MGKTNENNNVLKLTTEQETAITSDAQKMIVSASAGSGKTFVMIQRILNILKKKKESLDDFLVVTFTKAAASEMKAKLAEELEKLEDKDEFMKNQIHDIATANICTLDSYCAKLLKIYFYELDLDPGFIVIDDAEKTNFENKAFEQLFDECFEHFDRDFFELADILSGNRKLDNLKSCILRVHSFLSVQPEPEQFFYSTLESSHNLDLSKNPCVKVVNDYINDCINLYKEKFDQLFENAKMLNNKSIDEIMSVCGANLMHFNKNNSFEQNLRGIVLFQHIDTVSPTIKGEGGFVAGEVKDFKNSLNKLFDDFADKLEISVEDTINSLELSKKRIVKLYSLVKRFEEIFADLKKEKACLDFADLERYTYILLQKESVRESIKDKIKYVFVDEFQDINQLQENILNALSQNENVFLVGDVKQSIYAFRHCDPQIFINKQKQYENDKNAKNVLLNHNFRSHSDILNFANAIFSRTMKESFSGVNYKSEAMLVKGDNEIGKSKNENGVTIYSILKNKKEKTEEDFKLYSVLNDTSSRSEDFLNGELEGKIVAQEILKLKEQFIFLPKSKKQKERRVKFSDIVLLVSARDAGLANLCKQLELAGIPYSTDVDEEIFDDDSMGTLLNILKVVNNKKLDIELISVLTSDCFGFSFNELAGIKNITTQHNFFFECVEEFVSGEKFSGELQDRLIKFYKLIERYFFLSTFLTVSDLICEIVKDLEFELFALKTDDGKKKILKLNKLLESLNGKSYNENLAKYILNFADIPSSFQNVADENSVKITTIHKSKGLEYPIVFIPFLNKNFNEKDFNGDYILNKKYGVCLNNFNILTRSKFPTISMLASKINSREEMIKEKLRLFYVALTRPINYLYLIQNITDLDFENCDIKKAKSFSNFLNVLLRDKNNEKISDVENCFDSKIIYENEIEKLNFEIKKRDVVFADNFANTSSIKKSLNEIFGFEYPFISSLNIPQKISVSEINKNREENIAYLFDDEINYYDNNVTDFNNNNSNILNNKINISATGTADIGTAVHKALAVIDFNNNSMEQIKEQLIKLNKIGKLSSSEINLISAEVIYKLLNNETFTNYLKNCKYYLREKSFTSLINSGDVFENSTNEKIIVYGICDLIFVFENKIIVIDFKTSKIKNENFLIEKYKKQLQIYGDAISKNFSNLLTEKYIYSFELDKFLKI